RFPKAPASPGRPRLGGPRLKLRVRSGPPAARAGAWADPFWSRGYRKSPAKVAPAASPPRYRSSVRRPNSAGIKLTEATIASSTGYRGSRTARKLDNTPHFTGNLTFHTFPQLLFRGGSTCR